MNLRSLRIFYAGRMRKVQMSKRAPYYFDRTGTFESMVTPFNSSFQKKHMDNNYSMHLNLGSTIFLQLTLVFNYTLAKSNTILTFPGIPLVDETPLFKKVA